MSMSEEIIYRPSTVSPKLWRNYKDTFRNGIDMWTSEDGMRMGYAILPREDAAEALEFHWGIENFDKSRLRKGFMEWRYPKPEHEFFDHSDSRRRKIWTESQEETPFPVLFYDLYAEEPAITSTAQPGEQS